MTVLTKTRTGWFLGIALVLAIGFYAAYLQLRISELQRQIEMLHQEKELLQSVLAERDEQKALQAKLEDQLRQLSDQQQTKQQEELSRLRQQVQQIPILKAQNEQLKERLREITFARPPIQTRGSELALSAPADAQTYPNLPGVLANSPTTITNIALGKIVTSSVDKAYTGSLPQITDGVKNANQVVEMRKGTQWVQIDLEQEYPLHSVRIWHDLRIENAVEGPQKFRDVIVQYASDPEFTQNVRTLFNNDTDNSSALGSGNEKEYPETKEGKLINAQNVKTRFLRFYSRGSNYSAWNTYTEIEVYALVGANL